MQMYYYAGLVPSLRGLRQQIIILEYERGLLYRNGKFDRVLEPGFYRFWRWEYPHVIRVSLRQMSQVITGQEMLTADHIDVRVTLLAQYSVVDPEQAVHLVADYNQQLYQDLQLSLREAVSTQTLDALLEARSSLSDDLLEATRPVALTYGIKLNRVGVRDIILPKAMRDVMLKEIEADRSGRADLIGARHEVAAARARANSAKILAENPALMRLHELDALVALAEKPGNVVILPDLGNLFVPRSDS